MANTTPVTAKSIIYSDINALFQPHPVSRDVTRVTNEDAVKQSLKNILMTDHLERPFKPRFGGNIRKYLFDNITGITQHTIRENIKIVLANYEPRARIIDVIVKPSPDRNDIGITVIFSIETFREPIQLDLILQRIR